MTSVSETRILDEEVSTKKDIRMWRHRVENDPGSLSLLQRYNYLPLFMLTQASSTCSSLSLFSADCNKPWGNKWISYIRTNRDIMFLSPFSRLGNMIYHDQKIRQGLRATYEITGQFFDLIGFHQPYIFQSPQLEVNSSYLPTPPLGEDMTQGQFFKRSLTGLNSDFPSPRLVASPKLKNLVCPTIYP